MISKRQSVLLLDTRVSFSDLPQSLSAQKSGTELASNSQVDDLGNGKHLEQQEDSADVITDATTPSQVPAGFLVTEAGTRFRPEGDSQSMPGNLDAPADSQPSSIGYGESLLGTEIPGTQSTILTECTGSLGDELRGAYCETASKQRSEFLPIDALDKIVTEDRVREEIGKLSKCSDNNLDHDVQQVLGASNIPGQTTSRKKIFAILALIEKLEAIWDFVREGIYDIHLPFEKDKTQSPDGSRKGRLELSRKSDTGSSTRIPIKAFHGWTGAEVHNFERTQWDIHIPIFFLNTKKEPKVRHYPLQESVVLPFVEDDEVKQGGKMGGFAEVWRVKFHPSHHNHGVLASGRRENPSFAIKRLHYMDEKAFRKEVQNLKRFSTRDYLHLIKLLGTYEWRHQYYLVFPWADGNLLDFWAAHTEPLARKRDAGTALWFSEQCLGLVEGMKMIHTWDTPEIGGQHHVFSFDTRQTHGLHGDLKPENILWFKQYAENAEKNSSSLGHFKISDFGLSHFHGTKSIADIDAKDTGFSPTYRAPERDVKGKVTQSYDVWSLACVLLEFASWYLGGYEEVKTFGQKRVNEDMQYDGGFSQDRFFNFMRASQGAADEIQGRAQICAIEKISVVQEFEKLYDDPYCSDYLTDKGHILPAENVNGLNITGNEPSHPSPVEEQHRRPSGTQSAEQVPGVDNAAAEVGTTDRGLDSDLNGRETADESSPSKPGSSKDAEEQTNKDDGEPSQPVMDATELSKAHGVSQPDHPIRDANDEHEIPSSGVLRGVEFLKVPLGGEGRLSSESRTLSHVTSDVGQEDAHGRRTRNSSQTGSYGREKMEKQAGNAESVNEASMTKSTSDEKAGGRRFMSFLKKIPCFN
ncbi:hypothetical protein SLS64_009942 [Diaporthe eres]